MIKRMMVVCAHPDDCEITAGGLAVILRDLGVEVMFVSATNGDAGHQTLYGERIAAIRRTECDAVTRLEGISYTVMDAHDGQLEPTLANREALIRLIRSYRPDLIVTHNRDDYHPDHRNTVQLVRDSAYLLQVPGIARDTKPLDYLPAIWYEAMNPSDGMMRIDTDDVLARKAKLIACHRSQFLEWLPWIDYHENVPADPAGQEAYLEKRTRRAASRIEEALRAHLPVGVHAAEFYEPCRFGGENPPALVSLFSAARKDRV